MDLWGTKISGHNTGSDQSSGVPIARCYTVIIWLIGNDKTMNDRFLLEQMTPHQSASRSLTEQAAASLKQNKQHLQLMYRNTYTY